MPNTQYNPPQKKCAWCGKEFICHDPDHYVFKHHVNYKRGTTSMVWFCRWNHMRSWEKDHGGKWADKKEEEE